MEGKADVADLSLCLRLFHMGQNIVLHHIILPALITEGVQQVAVDVVGLQPLQLLIQDALEILLTGQSGHGHLGGQSHLLPVAIPKAQPCDPLTVGIDIGSVHICKTVVDGAAQGPDGPLLINGAVSTLFQTHHAEAQNGGRQAGIAEFPIFHINIPLLLNHIKNCFFAGYTPLKAMRLSIISQKFWFLR